MNKLLKTMDDQTVKWVHELDELYIRKTAVEKSIQKLEQLITKARVVTEEIRQGRFDAQRVGGVVFIPKDEVELVKKEGRNEKQKTRTDI